MTMTDESSPPPDMDVFYSDDARAPRSRRLRILAAVTALALVAGAGLGFAFTGGHNGAPARHPGSSTSTTSPFALNHDPAPSLAGAYSDNLVVAFRALYAFHNWVFNHPATDLVARYAAVGSPAYAAELTNVQYLATRQAHTPTDPRGYDGDIQYIRVALAPKPLIGSSGRQIYRSGHPAFGAGLITIVAKYIADNLYGPSGRYIQPGQKPGLAAISYSLSQGADGQWRLYGGTVLNPPGGPLSIEQ